ncbi:hypothetical protein SAMN05421763_1027 [[Luteovulum] sphaeroides subsp. megalophilum]|nr:hypothetical protein SAMN05421763_1027 [[Luteovulum] sphaeroides subsp. megalophilum]
MTGWPVPRTRGDVPTSVAASDHHETRSPHARGCPVRGWWHEPGSSPFPARAGMSRSRTTPNGLQPPVPRTRGDVPANPLLGVTITDRSPHARGCPARISLSMGWVLTVPRTRGDVPRGDAWHAVAELRSPHARGCPGCAGLVLRQQRPFPARAGMSRGSCSTRPAARPVPRTRGDVPWLDEDGNPEAPRSPHARGCPDDGRLILHVGPPFPARAGMSRMRCRRGGTAKAVPRTRGDVPAFAQQEKSIERRSPHARGCPVDDAGRGA